MKEWAAWERCERNTFSGIHLWMLIASARDRGRKSDQLSVECSICRDAAPITQAPRLRTALLRVEAEQREYAQRRAGQGTA